MERGHGASAWAPGQIWTGTEERNALDDRQTIRLEVSNSGDRPVQVGSHFHFFEVNRGLDFDRSKAYGMRLAIPAGTATRFEPGQTRNVDLIALGGERVVFGLGGLVSGRLDDEGARDTSIRIARKRGYLGA